MNFSKITNVIDFLSEHETYFDTNAVMSPGFEILIGNCLRLIRDKGIKIYIPYSVYNELKNLCNSENYDTAESAKKGIKQIDALAKISVVKFTDNPNNNCPATQFLIKTVIKYRAVKKLAVVTCNRKLSADILMQNSIKSFCGNHICCLNLSKGGFLYDYEKMSYDKDPHPTSNSACSESSEFSDLLKLFNIE